MPLMKAAQLTYYGIDRNHFQVVSIHVPEDVQPGHVLVRVHAASLNPVDYKLDRGDLVKGPLPVTQGHDFAGEIVKCGEGSNLFKVGDRVFGGTGLPRGAFAEYVVVPESNLASIPTKIDYSAAAALPSAGLTAYQGLVTHAKDVHQIGSSSKVLILGGTGGVGTFAVQIAKAFGAHVTATGTDIELLQRLGADVAVNYRVAQPEGTFDIVFDTVGGHRGNGSWKTFVTPGQGIFLTIVGDFPDGAVSPEQFAAEMEYSDPNYKFFFVDPSAQSDLEAFCKLVEAGQVTPIIAPERFSLDTIFDAYQTLMRHRVKGKLVIDI